MKKRTIILIIVAIAILGIIGSQLDDASETSSSEQSAPKITSDSISHLIDAGALENAEKLLQASDLDSLTVLQLQTRILQARYNNKLEALRREINTIDTLSWKHQTKDEIIVELALIDAWKDMALEAEQSDSIEMQKLGKKLEYKLSRLQRREFPVLRKQYGKILADAFWEHDIYVSTTGSSHNIINFTGVIFASNKHIKDFYTELAPMLNRLRYKYIRFRWYKGQSDYTYYKLNIPNDASVQ